MSQVFNVDGARVTVFHGAPQWGDQPTMALGKFACKTAQSGQTVLAQAEAAARAQGCRRLIGPMDGTTWNSYRLITDSDGTKPFLMEPTSGPEDMAAFEAAGFVVIERYFSARVALEGMDNPAPIDGSLTITPWDGTDPEGHFSQVYDLSLQAFSGNAFYTPISREAFLALYMPFVPVLKPEFLLFARDVTGELVGYLFGIPNYGESQQPTTVILKTYASVQKGAGQALASVFHQTAKDEGYSTAIHALIHDTNLSAMRSAQLGANVFRRYALLGKILDANAS